MEVKTDFSIGEDVYFFTNRKIIRVKVNKIYIEISDSIKIEYRVDFNEKDIKELKLRNCEWVSKDFLFKSKEDFINKL